MVLRSARAEKFVRLTSKPRLPKSTTYIRARAPIAVGAHARYRDLDPEREVTLTDAMMHDLAAIRPMPPQACAAGRSWCCRADAVIVADGKRSAEPGFGRFLARSGGDAAKPTSRLVADMDPARNFGATLL